MNAQAGLRSHAPSSAIVPHAAVQRIPSLNLSTGFTMGSYAAVPAWSWAASKSVGIRAAFNFYMVPARFAAQAATYARLAATQEKAVPVLQLLSLIAAEGQGLTAEWDAATSGACQGVF